MSETLDEIAALKLAEEVWADEPTDAEQLLMQRVVSSDWLAALLCDERARATRQALRDAANLAQHYDTGEQAAGALRVTADIAERATATNTPAR